MAVGDFGRLDLLPLAVLLPMHGPNALMVETAIPAFIAAVMV